MRNKLDGSGQAQQPTQKTGNSNEPQGTHRMLANGVEGDEKPDGSRGAGEDQEHQEQDASNNLKGFPTHDASHLSYIRHHGVLAEELMELETSKLCDCGKEDHCNDTRDKSNSLERRWKR